MKYFMLSLIVGFTATTAYAVSACPKPWVCQSIKLATPKKVSLRAGYLPERGTFKGNVLYFQGLADSMLNHAPLFNKLTAAGFRVIAFDYMGQGGSEGSMNDTRMSDIILIGDMAWRKFARLGAAHDEKNIIGWSTGGLAAYMAAAKKVEVKKVVLIAPGLAPDLVVGGGIFSWPVNEITMESLTSDDYTGQNTNPHVDPIFPSSPLVVPLFSTDLIATSVQARHTTIPTTVQGLMLSGTADSYVNHKKNLKVLKNRAPQFLAKSYTDGRHELDNEQEVIRDAVHQAILSFLQE